MTTPVKLTAVVGRTEQPVAGGVSLNVTLQIENTPDNAALFSNGKPPALSMQLIGLTEAAFAGFKSGEKVTLTLG